jgi:prepilin-type N-terminal cleavage/methylation domain-containing protein
MLMREQRGFTLTEVAVAFLIIALLLGGAVMTLQAQIEQRNFDEAQRRLNAAAETVLSFALINRRLPCPARYVNAATHSGGRESFCNNATALPAACAAHTVANPPAVLPLAHGNCSTYYDGYLPAVTLGTGPVDSSGFAVDPWGNRLRYVVAMNYTGCPNPPPAATPRLFTSQANLKSAGIGCLPNDLDICTTSGCVARAVSQQTAVFIVYSTGKNGARPAAGPDEAANLDGNATFVMHVPDPQFDDLMLPVPVGQLYSRLVSGGILP